MVVGVKFRGTPWKTYDYLTDLDLKKGDLVVVPVGPLSKGCGFAANLNHVSIVEVATVKPESDKAFAWVISKVDFEDYFRKMAERKHSV